MKQLASQPVRLLINTEPHADHTSGHFVFSPPAGEIGAPRVMTVLRIVISLDVAG